MGFIPSLSLEPVLQRARAGVWVDPLPEERIALVCKMPDTLIKAVFRGCQCTLVLGVVEADGRQILCPGLMVKDEPEHPFTVAGPPWTVPQYVTLMTRILTTGTASLHLVNELTHPVLSAACTLESNAAMLALKGLASAPLFLLSPSSENIPSLAAMARLAEEAMNRFQELIYRPAGSQVGTSSQMTAFIDLSLELRKPIEIFEVTPSTKGGPFRIDDEDEGKKLERELYLALGRIYPGRTYLSPKVGGGAAARELTDVLAFDERFICLLESKAVSALQTSIDRPSKRRASTVRKHVSKALRQLRGALLTLRSDAIIHDGSGEPISLPHRQIAPAHAVVLLSDMYFFVDWRAVASEVLEASEDERYMAQFHVMDLQEFIYLADRSIDSEQFSGFLIQRWLHVRMKGTVYGRAKMRSELPREDD